MTAAAKVLNPGLGSYVKTLKNYPVETNIEHLISLLKRRQIRNSRQCAIATLHVYLRFISHYRGRNVEGLLDQIRKVGRRLIAAQPREMVVGNIVKRILALVREIAEGESDPNADTMISENETSKKSPTRASARPPLTFGLSSFSPFQGRLPMESVLPLYDGASDSHQRSRPPLLSSFTSAAPGTHRPMFELFSTPEGGSPASTPGPATPPARGSLSTANLATLADFAKDIKAELIEGIREMLDELDQVDEQIAGYALEQIHANEVVLTHTSSETVQKFLLTAAKKRKFTVVHAESFPNDHEDTRSVILHGHKRDVNNEDGEADDRFKTLIAAGITVVVIPDSAVYAIMSRVNKVILATHTVLANGALIAAAGARNIAKAAREHKTRVVVLSGVYKLSPVDTFDASEFIEYGDSGKAAPYSDGDFVDAVDVLNPLYDYVPANLVDLYITNLGGYAPSHLHRIVSDHYNKEDISLGVTG